MKILVSRFSRSLLFLSLCALLIPGTVVFAPSDAHAFGSLTENGTAQFMGIGIAPQKILHVSGTGPGTVPLFVRGSDSAGFIIERTPANRWVLGVNESPTLGNGFVLSTIPTGNTSVPRLMITQEGNVGIGTISPTAKLDVETGSGAAIYCMNTSSDSNVSLAEAGYGVLGSTSTGGGAGVRGSGSGSNTAGVTGTSSLGTGVVGLSGSGGGGWEAGKGVYGKHLSSNNCGYIGSSNYGVYGYSNSGYAGYFEGNGVVTDNLSIGKTTAANSTFQVVGSFATKYTYVSSGPYDVAANDSIILCNSSGSAFQVNLPTGAGIVGRQYTIKRINNSAGCDVTIDAFGAEKIDQQDTYTLTGTGSGKYTYLTVVTDGSNWWVIANN